MIRTHAGERARDRRPVLVRLVIFIEERFPPATSLPLICLFTAAGFVPSAYAMRTTVDPVRLFAAAAVVGLAMLHLRMVDELKDGEVDRLGRPERPLPRGLVTAWELSIAAAAGLALALAISAALGLEALLWFLPAAAYIALADAQFFAAERVHRDLAVYALVHSPIVALLMAFAWSAAGPVAPLAILPGLVVLAWGVGLGLELTRKIRAPEEERPFVETYSSALGHGRALWLAGGALSVAALGGALYAWRVGAGTVATPGALAAAVGILAIVPGLRRRRRRAIESAGAILGVGILLWPIAVALVVRGVVP